MMMEVLTFFFAAVVVAAAVLVALLVLVAVAGLVVVGAPVVVALGPRCGEEETKNRRRFQQEVCWTVERGVRDLECSGGYLEMNYR